MPFSGKTSILVHFLEATSKRRHSLTPARPQKPTLHLSANNRQNGLFQTRMNDFEFAHRFRSKQLIALQIVNSVRNKVM